MTAGTEYVAQVYLPAGHYSAATAFFAAPVVNGPLTGLRGTYAYGADTFPTGSWNNSHYFVDVLYTSQDTAAPTVAGTSPAAGTTAQRDASVTATFARAIDPAALTFTLVDGAGAGVAGMVAYDAPSRVATFAPAGPLPAGTRLTATVRASSTGGIPMPEAYSWSFDTAAAAPAGEAFSLYTGTDAPATAAWPDAGPVTVGIRFTPGRSGSVTAVKFLARPGNNGPYDVAVWSSAGTGLGSGRATANASGWKTVVLGQPVPVTAGTTYVASYRGAVGRYAVTSGGLRTGKTVGPLSVPAKRGGVYSYPDAAPTATTSTDFFVDVVAVLEPAASPPPVVRTTTPASGQTSGRSPTRW